MANMNQEMKLGKNEVEVVGVIKESKLKNGSSDKGKYINGSFVVKTGEFSENEVNVFVYEKNSQGNVRKAYTILESILNKNLKTMADGASEEEATKVRIWGSNGFTPHFTENMYVSKQDGEVKSIRRVDLGFGNVTIDDKITPEDYKATFDVEMYVDKVVDEMKMEQGIQQMTGRLNIEGLIPMYGGLVMPITIVAGIIKDNEGEFNFAEQLKGAVYQGMTLRLWGNINHQQIIEKVKVGGGLGRAKVEEKKTYINELVSEGGEIISDINKVFDIEQIKQGMVNRETKKEEQKNKPSKSKDNKGKGLNSSFGANNSSDKPLASPF